MIELELVTFNLLNTKCFCHCPMSIWIYVLYHKNDDYPQTHISLAYKVMSLKTKSKFIMQDLKTQRQKIKLVKRK